MAVQCDRCGLEIEKESAIVRELGEDIYYFCSLACAENPERLPTPEEEDLLEEEEV